MTVNNFEKMEMLFTNLLPEYYIPGVIVVRNKDFVSGTDIYRLYTMEPDVKFYAFRSYRELQDAEEQITRICKSLNARFYVYPRAVKFINTTMDLLEDILVSTRSYTIKLPAHNVVYNMKHSQRTDRGHDLVLVDLDNMDYKDKFEQLIEKSFPDKIIMNNPSSTGHHYLMHNFSIDEIKGSKEDMDELQHEIEEAGISFKSNSALLVYFYGKYPFKKSFDEDDLGVKYDV